MSKILKCECNGLQAIREGDAWTPCICVLQKAISTKLSPFGEYKYKNPKVLLGFEPVIYLEGEISNLLGFLAGYMVVKNKVSMRIESVQHYFDQRMLTNDYSDYITPETLILYFGNIAPNKIIAQYVSQVCEERRILQKNTWMVSNMTIHYLLERFRDGKEDFSDFIKSIPRYKIYESSIVNMEKSHADNNTEAKRSAVFSSKAQDVYEKTSSPKPVHKTTNKMKHFYGSMK